jgi:hypothetical protein
MASAEKIMEMSGFTVTSVFSDMKKGIPTFSNSVSKMPR